MNIYYSKSKGKYYALETNNFFCSKCSKPLMNLCFLKSDWFLKKKGSVRPKKEKLLCLNCVKKINDDITGDYQESRVIILVRKLPFDAVPIIKTSPQTRVSMDSSNVFDAADNIYIPVGEDKTRLSGRSPSIEGAQIGNFDKDLIKEKDKDLSEDEGLGLLDDLFIESQIGYDDRKRIGSKKEDGKNEGKRNEGKQKIKAVAD